MVVGGLGQELTKLLKQVPLVLEELGHLSVDFCLRQVLARGRVTVLDGLLVALVCMQDCQELFVDIRLSLKPNEQKTCNAIAKAPFFVSTVSLSPVLNLVYIVDGMVELGLVRRQGGSRWLRRMGVRGQLSWV